jgi:probable HAF family extracellular repeat protein
VSKGWPRLSSGTNYQSKNSPLFPADLAGVALAINDKGEAAGFTASCAGGHALMWKNGTAIDLGSLGGTFGVANAINNQGTVVGNSNVPGDETSHAFLWQSGVMSDLGVLPGDFGSVALGINNEGQVVGDSADENGEHPFLWQNGVMTNLNDLIPAASPLFLIDANGINSRGEISGLAYDTNTGELRGYLAIPTNGTAKGNNAMIEAQGRRGETRKVTLPPNIRKLIQRQLGRHYNFPHTRTLPSN